MSSDATAEIDTQIREIRYDRLVQLIQMAAVHQAILELSDRVQAFQRKYAAELEGEDTASPPLDCSR